MSFLSNVKQGYITRNVDISKAKMLLDVQPVAGDLLLCRVDKIRQHTRLENTQGRREHLYEGDNIIVVAAQRYATDQFCAELPILGQPSHLVAAGGIAGNVTHRSQKVKAPTEITLQGVIGGEDGKALNLSSFAPLETMNNTQINIPVLVIVGSDMNAGKTTTACACINGLFKEGIRVAGAKLTGTGAGPDYWRMKDAGACHVIDFVDAGFPSTVGLSTDNFTHLLQRFKESAQKAEAQVLVLEIADGILQPETKSLMNSEPFINEVTGVIVAADSATSAIMVAERVLSAGFSLYAISGLLTRSPIACEEATMGSGLPVFTAADLSKKSVIDYLYNTMIRDHENTFSAVG